MKMHATLFAASLFIALSACGESAEDTAPTDGATLARQDNAKPDWRDHDMLASKDCGTVAQFYFDAIALREFDKAAFVWDDPVVDDARLAALFSGYAQPQFNVDKVMEESAAGAVFCTVTGALADLADPSKVLREGEIVLRRTQNVPGASPDQLRWTVQSSTFIEDMERAGRGEPA